MKMLLPKIAISATLLGLPLIAVAADPVQQFLADTFEPTTNLSRIPDRAKKVLNAYIRGARIANSTEPFEATDMISDRSLPRRRLVLAGTGPHLTFIEYEHGGFGLHEHLLLISDDGGDKARMAYACAGLLAHTIEGLKTAVRDGTCKKENGAVEH